MGEKWHQQHENKTIGLLRERSSNDILSVQSFFSIFGAYTTLMRTLLTNHYTHTLNKTHELKVCECHMKIMHWDIPVFRYVLIVEAPLLKDAVPIVSLHGSSRWVLQTRMI